MEIQSKIERNFVQMFIKTLRIGGAELGVGGKLEKHNFFFLAW